MNRRKKLTAAVLSLVLFFALSACSPAQMPVTDYSKPTIVCTAFPQYDWTLQVLGERAVEFNVVLLNHQGTDMHSFQPTAANMVSMANCNLFIHIGGYSEGWVAAALESAGNENAEVITLLDYVDARAEEFTEGMEHNHDHDHSQAVADNADHHGHENEDHETDSELDEHMWLSLRCAQQACDVIADAVCQLDPANADFYRTNAATYKEELHHLDHEYEDTVQNASTRVLLFADRFPFRYLTDDYGLEYLAAFPGCSAETEASFETILYLSEEMEAHQLTCAVILEGSRDDFARTVVSNTEVENPRILTLNSMQSVNQRHIDAGVTYLSIMEGNLTVLKEALK